VETEAERRAHDETGMRGKLELVAVAHRGFAPLHALLDERLVEAGSLLDDHGVFRRRSRLRVRRVDRDADGRRMIRGKIAYPAVRIDTGLRDVDGNGDRRALLD